MTGKGERRMREYWDERARLNAPWYVDTSLAFDAPDMERFFESGRRTVGMAFEDVVVRPGEIRPIDRPECLRTLSASHQAEPQAHLLSRHVLFAELEDGDLLVPALPRPGPPRGVAAQVSSSQGVQALAAGQTVHWLIVYDLSGGPAIGKFPGRPSGFSPS